MSYDETIFALTADVGYKNFDAIVDSFPDRFINVGVAESNMINIAAGLALAGKKPFTFTLAPFATMRCLEQIRINLCYHNLPVKIIGAGGGLVYGAQGTTHHALEEIGILRCLPNMTVLVPSDPIETKALVRLSLQLEGPCYIRIGRNGEPHLYDKENFFEIGRSLLVRNGTDATIIASGLLLKNALTAADELAREKISVRVVDVHTIKPIDSEMIERCAKETSCIITLEEHNTIGGLGSAVAEILSAIPSPRRRFKKLGIQDVYCSINASYTDLLTEYGLDVNNIKKEIRNLL